MADQHLEKFSCDLCFWSLLPRLLLFLKLSRKRIAQLCSKCATQLTCIKEGYNFLSVFPAKDMYGAASVKNNTKFSRFISSCRNMSFTVCRIILVLTLLPLSSGWQSTRNVWFGASNLPTSTLIYFCLATSASSTVKIIFCLEVILEFVLLFDMLI